MAWHSEPTHRGTYSILSNCLVTLVLCIWTAMHLNIPAYGVTSNQKWKKLAFCILGVLEPEIIVWIAYTQNQHAREIHKLMASVYGAGEILRPPWYRRVYHRLMSDKPDELNSTLRRHVWTMTHSHFVAMGGFVLEKDPNNNNNNNNNDDCFCDWPPDHPSLTLGLCELRRLAETDSLDLLPNISEEEIADKSNASGIAKFLVCLQAAWFCIQCINRWAQSLSMSLLELNTFAHCLCAFMMYYLWWHKPLDVDEPTRIQGSQLETLIAQLDQPTTSRPSSSRDHTAWGIISHCEHRMEDLECRPLTPVSQMKPAISDRPRLLRIDGSIRREVIGAIGIGGLVYGGIHLSAWNAPLNSLRLWMWRGSALTLCCSGAIPPLSFSYFTHDRGIYNPKNWGRSSVHPLVFAITIAVVAISPSHTLQRASRL